MPLAGWWDRQQAQRRLAKRRIEVTDARNEAATFERLRRTRVESGRGSRFYPSALIDSFAVAESHDQVARLTEEAARFEADRDREFTWTWRCMWTDASEQATQRIGAPRVGRTKSTILYRVAHHRVFAEAVRDRRFVEYANGWPEPFLVLQSVPAEIAVFLIGACYGRYTELLDDADEWPIEPSGDIKFRPLST
jgi:hypothetical protein